MRPSAEVRRATCQVKPLSDSYTKSVRHDRRGSSFCRIPAAMRFVRGTTSASTRATTVSTRPITRMGRARRWKEIPPALAATTSRCVVIEWIVNTAATSAAMGNDHWM